MHDIRTIRADARAFDAAMARRGLDPCADALIEEDAARRAALTRLQELQGRRKELARTVGEARRRGGDTAVAEAEAVRLRDEVEAAEQAAAAAAARLRDALAGLPNVLDPDVPDGPDETANVVLSQTGAPRNYAFTPRQHFELGEAMGLMDFETAARLAGTRFVVLRGALARLERALGQFMLDMHVTEHGYTETVVPSLVREEVLFGTGQLPKFADQQFVTTDGRWLIPTAEVPLTNLAAGQILSDTALPMRVASLTDCFRSEAGAAGRDTRGMLRQHQFRKVEMVSITRPEDSDAEHERMTGCAERVLAALDLCFRRIVLASGDTGATAVKTYDLEVWLPGQAAWREISSCSNTRAFQARRMEARYRPAGGGAPEHVHTLNGSGVAVGRALIAVMETHQQADGSVLIPPALHPYLGGMTRIG